MYIRSLRLGLTGQADVVEFHGTNPKADAKLSSAAVVPVEYKRGRPKAHRADEVQLCAQALCLEEMLSLPSPIPNGRLFYGQTRRRQDVPLNDNLRRLTLDTITRLRTLMNSRDTPRATYQKAKCDRCSLLQLCMPKQLRPRRTAEHVFQIALKQALDSP